MDTQSSPFEESEVHTQQGQRESALANILKGYEDFRLDINGKIMSSNLEAVNVTGYEEWEAIGRNFSMFYTKSDQEAGLPKQELDKASTESKVTFSAWRVKKRNVTFWAQVTFICLKEDDGLITGYRMILKDQTHRLISLNRVKRFRNEYLNLFNNPFIGVIKFRYSDLKLILINGTAEQIFGKGQNHKTIQDVFFNPNEFQVFFDVLNKRKKVIGFEFQVRRGVDVWARIDCKLFSEEGFVEGVISDVSPNRLQMIELKRLNEELDSFIYHASHDLRSPLTTLLGLINLVEFDKQIELAEYCRLMRDRVNSLDELLRDMAAIVADSREEIKIESIEFDDILKKVQQDLRLGSSSTNIKLSIQNEEKPFYSDKLRVESIFRYLISFAHKSCKVLPRELSLEISVNVFEDLAVIKFADNGNGLDDGQILQVFRMFYKINSEVKETGLGLYIAKHIVEKLGGSINAKSKIGIGTEFQIELPQLIPETKFSETDVNVQSCKGMNWEDFCEVCQGFIGKCPNKELRSRNFASEKREIVNS